MKARVVLLCKGVIADIIVDNLQNQLPQIKAMMQTFVQKDSFALQRLASQKNARLEHSLAILVCNLKMNV